MDNRLLEVEAKIEEVALRDEIVPLVLDYNRSNYRDEFLFEKGQVLEAKETYQEIYSLAKKNIVIIGPCFLINIHSIKILGRYLFMYKSVGFV